MDLSTISIDHASPIPVHYQVYEALRAAVVSSGSGTKLVPEREMAERIGVSRQTLRKALNRLEAEGVLIRRPGAGTYVAPDRFAHKLESMDGFTHEFTKSGRRVNSRIISLKRVQTPGDIKYEGVDSPLSIELRRVRELEGEPVSLQTVWLPATTSDRIMETNGKFESLYFELMKLGIVPVEGSEQLSATILDDFESSYLDVPIGSPALLLERQTFDAEGTSVEWVKSILRADRFKITTNMAIPVEPSKEKDYVYRKLTVSP